MQIKRGYIITGAVLGLTVLTIGIVSYRKSAKQGEGGPTFVPDKKTGNLLNSLEPAFRRKVELFLAKCKAAGMDVRVTSTKRSCAEQTKLYNQGRTTPGKRVTNARCGQSSHNYGLAVDVVQIKNGKALWTNPNWSRIGQIGKSVGMEWGGDWKSFKDRPHFQDLGGRSIASRYRHYQQTGNLVA